MELNYRCEEMCAHDALSFWDSHPPRNNNNNNNKNNIQNHGKGVADNCIVA